MDYHWTYCEYEADSNLEQGDFLWPTTDLAAVLSDVHPHFCDDKYVGFVVATQSCDLVRRADGPPAKYINIAAVRSLKQVLPRLVSSVAGQPTNSVFFTRAKGKASELLQRVVDQNEQSLGLFYLHNDAELGIGDPSVAYLRVTVSLRCEHYDVMVAARRGRLAPAFQAKLGWLLGNLYARPATPDWADAPEGKEACGALIRDLLDTLHWVGEAELSALRVADPSCELLDPAELVRRANRQKVKRPMDELADIAAELAKKRADDWLAKRLQTFEHHVRKRLSEASTATAAEPLPDQVGAIARETFVGITDKESDSVALGFRSDARAKRIASRLGS